MFNTLIVTPFGWVMRQCYEFLGSYGIAIIVFTIIAKLVILPFQMKSKKSMMEMNRLQPKLKELEKKYAGNKEKYSMEVSKLYKSEGVSMFGGCLPLLITLPIMIGLYSVVRQPLTHIFALSGEQIKQLATALAEAGAKVNPDQVGYMLEVEVAANISKYKEVVKAISANLAELDFTFLGLDLAAMPTLKFKGDSFIQFYQNLTIPVLSGLTAWLSNWFIRKSSPAPANGQGSMNMMNWLMPVMSVYIAFVVPAGLGLYWIVSNLLSAAQEPLLTKYYKGKAEKKAAEGEIKNGK